MNDLMVAALLIAVVVGMLLERALVAYADSRVASAVRLILVVIALVFALRLAV